MDKFPTLVVAVLAGLVAGAGFVVPVSCRAESTPSPRIVNGALTTEFETTGALLIFTSPSHSQIAAFCSGTLIGCHTFLTAAHCVCPDNRLDARSCERRGSTDPLRLAVYLQGVGVIPVTNAMIHPQYSFAERSDLALLTLSQAADGLIASRINRSGEPDVGAAAQIVGFGITSGSEDDGGIKRAGKATVAGCRGDLPEDQLLCWRYDGSESNICGGDSGGPLFLEQGGELVLSGVSSGGNSDGCVAPDQPFDTDVFVNREWIAENALDLSDGLPCGSGGAAETLLTSTGSLNGTHREVTFTLDVPPGAAELRVAANGQFWNQSNFGSTAVDFDLELVGPNGVACRDDSPTSISSCRVASPPAGAWRATLTRFQGDGPYQLTASVLSSDEALRCAGDCDADGNVTVDEVVEGINIALGVDDVSGCDRLDSNHDSSITVDEILVALASALNGCE